MEENKYLDFEKPLEDLENQINQLKFLQRSRGIDYYVEIFNLMSDIFRKTHEIYDNLSAWQIIQITRHLNRPVLKDYIELMIEDFCELHGDKCFADDPSIITGFGRIQRQKIMIIGHNKGRTTEERIKLNFGMAYPEGYRKALLKMKLAEKFNIPIVCFIDTPGAYCGIEAEERGIAEIIAINMMEMSRLKVPIICIIIGEGGSGGAIGIGVGDRLAMLQYAYYSVISPEACSVILWKNNNNIKEAAEQLKLTAKDLLKFGIIDDIISEPLRGAHIEPYQAINNVKYYLLDKIKELKKIDVNDLLERRYKKIRNIGMWKII